jgi:hypothetical protein
VLFSPGEGVTGCQARGMRFGMRFHCCDSVTYRKVQWGGVGMAGTKDAEKGKLYLETK